MSRRKPTLIIAGAFHNSQGVVLWVKNGWKAKEFYPYQLPLELDGARLYSLGAFHNKEEHYTHRHQVLVCYKQPDNTLMGLDLRATSQHAVRYVQHAWDLWQAEEKARRTSCVGCGTPGAPLWTYPGTTIQEHMCPQCAAETEEADRIYDAATQDLIDSLTPAVQAWVARWALQAHEAGGFGGIFGRVESHFEKLLAPRWMPTHEQAAD